jgi:hypothetical protein
MRLYQNFKNKILRWFYERLVLKTEVVNKLNIWRYDKLEVFSTFALNTNKGEICFSFRKDRHTQLHEEKNTVTFLSCYFVEMTLPLEYQVSTNKLYNKVIVVTMWGLRNPDYKVMGRMLIREYLRTVVTRD